MKVLWIQIHNSIDFLSIMEKIIMKTSENMLLDQAFELSAKERANIAEKLLFSLDTPDSKIDAV
ncbi:[weak similarity to] Addiction module component, CHP02574 [methanotrophic bacterial endosymbiont of Bathymodiolus sp.]|nr:[weak similarity to] Addiction module component, CHP02574 [methanotrophic bacterial endosymbiont of Bathymodiolus sp.]